MWWLGFLGSGVVLGIFLAHEPSGRNLPEIGVERWIVGWGKKIWNLVGWGDLPVVRYYTRSIKK